MQLFIDLVEQFMQAKGIPTRDASVKDLAIGEGSEKRNTFFRQVSVKLAAIAADIAIRMEANPDEPTYVRVQGMVEELAEFCEAIAEGDEVKALDALADEVIFVMGTAITFDLPLQDAVATVHASNMTKANRVSGQSSRLASKGPDYRPPNLKEVLRRYRTGKLPLTTERGAVRRGRVLLEPQEGTESNDD